MFPSKRGWQRRIKKDLSRLSEDGGSGAIGPGNKGEEEDQDFTVVIFKSFVHVSYILPFSLYIFCLYLLCFFP